MFAAVLLLGDPGGAACAPTAAVPPATPTVEGIQAERFVLHLRTGARLEGVDGIILPDRVRGRSDRGFIDVNRSDLSSIHVTNRTRAPEFALLGLAFGAVFGLSVGAAAFSGISSTDHHADPVIIAESTAVSAAAFAGIFTLIGLRRPKWDAIE